MENKYKCFELFMKRIEYRLFIQYKTVPTYYFTHVGNKTVQFIQFMLKIIQYKLFNLCQNNTVQIVQFMLKILQYNSPNLC